MLLDFFKSVLPWKRYKHFVVRNPGFMPQPSMGCSIENQRRLKVDEAFNQAYHRKYWGE